MYSIVDQIILHTSLEPQLHRRCSRSLHWDFYHAFKMHHPSCTIFRGPEKYIYITIVTIFLIVIIVFLLIIIIAILIFIIITIIVIIIIIIQIIIILIVVIIILV